MENEYTLILILIISIFVVLIYYRYIDSKKNDNMLNKEEFYNNFITIDDDNIDKDNGETCTKSTCDSIDPVSDPKYNMHQIIKQSILLEEHLSNKNKRCRDCITKHFSHIIGLAEEAVMLACSDANSYPYMTECPDFYNKLFKMWLNDTSLCLEICKELRVMRKKLIATYFFDETYGLQKTDDIGVK
jgi:hypothetical protein